MFVIAVYSVSLQGFSCYSLPLYCFLISPNSSSLSLFALPEQNMSLFRSFATMVLLQCVELSISYPPPTSPSFLPFLVLFTMHPASLTYFSLTAGIIISCKHFQDVLHLYFIWEEITACFRSETVRSVVVTAIFSHLYYGCSVTKHCSNQHLLLHAVSPYMCHFSWAVENEKWNLKPTQPYLTSSLNLLRSGFCLFMVTDSMFN